MNRADFDVARAARARALGLSRYDGVFIADGAEPDEHHVARLRVTWADVTRALRPTPPDYCGGRGYVGFSDDYYDCVGCLACAGRYAHRVVGYRAADRAESWALAGQTARAAWGLGAALWQLANFQAHDAMRASLRGFEALATVGTQLAAVGALANSVAGIFWTLGQWWQTPEVGAWVRVTGGRGRAREHVGLEGEVTWVGEGTGYAGRRGSLRVGVKALGADKPVYVAAAHAGEARDR